MTYEEAKAAKAELEAQERDAAARLKEWTPQSPNGLTPDRVKRDPSYIWAKQEHESAFFKLQGFNSQFLAKFGREYRAERRTRKSA